MKSLGLKVEKRQKKKAAQQLPLNVNPQTHNTRNGIMTQVYSNSFNHANFFK